LDKNKLLHVPQVPLNVALVTSYDSAAYHDFIDELKKSGFAFKVFVANAIMQGKNAQTSVVKVLAVFNRMEGLDVIVITRGGGSIAELSCFDSEPIALAIADSHLPVVSGIGHEINTTVTDLAAHTFAKTPTAVARFLVSRVEEFLGGVNEKQDDLVRLTQKFIEGEQRRLGAWAAGLRTSASLIKGSKQRLVQGRENLKKIIQLRLQNERAKIINYGKIIEMADPINTVKRGFTITRGAGGKIIRSIKDARKTKILTTVLADGQVESNVCGVIGNE
jgi:exodeoxyribonuclease VII large subunit